MVAHTIVNPDALAGMTLDEMETTLAALVEHKRFNKIDFFDPYPKQWDFIAMGKDKKERLLMAGNQLGKSECGAFEVATHLTGLYPDTWPGRVFDRPNDWWAAGVSTTAVRDIQQAKLFGEPGVEDSLGTGFIPKHCIAGKPTLARGAVANSYDTAKVVHFRHSHQARNSDPTDDGISILQFKSYEQGREKFQGKTLSGGVWWDEEPEQEVYTEGNARWSATDGMSLMTFTPLQGFTNVVARFLEQHSPLRDMVKFRAEECPHMTPAKIAELKDKYPDFEWEARLNGEPKLGSGAIFRTPEEFIKFPLSQLIAPHWPVIWGIDFGITHPFAAVLAAWDRDHDVIYLIATYKAAGTLPIVDAEALRGIAANAPVAWPHDGHKREKGTGESLAKVYKALQLRMLPSHAHFQDGSISTEAAVLEMQQRFACGRLRVREDLEDFFVECRGYHRDKDGFIVKLRDDLISATMKVIMAKRQAKVVELGWRPRVDTRTKLSQRPKGRGVINPWTGRAVSPMQ